MNPKKEKDRRAEVRFSAEKFSKLPMGEKLVYLRAAFDAVGGGKRVIEIPGKRPPSKSGRTRTRPPSYIRLLAMAGFEKLTIHKKIAYLKYLARAYAELQLQM